MSIRSAAKALALTVLLASLAPGLALAADGTPVVRLVLYEVTEALTFKMTDHDNMDELVRRLAHASLLGRDVIPLASTSPYQAGQYVVADARSSVDLATLRGPVRGQIEVLTDLDPTRNSLDTLLVSARIQIEAELDLTLAATSAVALIGGTWWDGANHLQGTFTGFFAIPFQLDGLPGQYWYVNYGPGACATGSIALGSVCSVTMEEFALGIPLTKAVAVFSSDGSSKGPKKKK